MSILTNFRQAPKKQKTVCSKRIEAFTVRGFIYVTSKVMLACGQLKGRITVFLKHSTSLKNIPNTIKIHVYGSLIVDKHRLFKIDYN